ncbi:MAG TPA: YihY/virulence factor BrkB family protein, partial [Gemmatimonadales bacterium]|nr:YihY/virulence factor BrkB family protein [Gemmatimonadales bacterium]
MKVPLVFRVLRESLRGWSRDNVPRLGASIAYYTLFSLAPILMIAIAIAGLLFGEEAVRGQIVHQADDLLGREGAVALQALLEGASRERDGGTVALIGTITFLVAATGAFMELQHALNTIFKVKQSPRSKLKEFIKDRVRSFGLVVSIGFLLLVSLLVSAALTALSDWMQRTTGDGLSFIWQIVNIVISLAVITVLFALIFRYLPDA